MYLVPSLSACRHSPSCSVEPGIALRSVKHAWHGFSVILFYSFVVLGLSASGLYKKLTPNM